MEMMNMPSQGILYLCGTPIGNLKDITLRALEILKSADLIAAEDTRRTGKLLEHFEINKPLTSYHEHNEKKKAEKLLEHLRQGEKVVLVSDAGMPGISDPGYEIVKKTIEEGIELIPIPGPTALISALVVSGLTLDRFVFEGFLPRKGKEREERINRIREEERTIVFYESPYRLQDTMEELVNFLPERNAAVIREISKIHEEKLYGTVSDICSKLQNREIKGEVVVVLAGREKIKIENEGWEGLSIVEHVELLMENGYTKKKAIKKVASLRGISKREVYEKCIIIEAGNR